MRAIKIAFTLFFLALGTACRSKYVTRSFCANNYDRFGPFAQRDLKTKFSIGVQNIQEHLKANKPHKKANQDPTYKKLTKAQTDFDSETAKLYVVAEKGNAKQLTAYCEYLVDLYNWLHNEQRCGNGNKYLYDKVCQPCAAHIQLLFEIPADTKKVQKEEAVVYRPVVQQPKQKKDNRNKYAHMKPKKNQFKSFEIPAEKKSEVVAPAETVYEEVNHISPILTEEERRVVHDTFYEPEEVEVSAKPEQEVMVQVQTEAPKKRKRVIVVEVLACENCTKDAFLKKYMAERK